MAKDKKTKLADIHALALKNIDIAMLADRENRERALQDALFVAGEQWPQEVKLARQNRPMLTINRLPQFVRIVSNEVRQKPPSINIIPAEDGDRATAQVMEGMCRQIENISAADRVYSAALEDSCRCGMGFMKIYTDYADEDSFEQDIFIKHIRNPLSVIFDPDMQDMLGSDAKYATIFETMTVEAFKAKYPGKAYQSVGTDGTDKPTTFVWYEPERVKIAEHWVVEEEQAEIVKLQDGSVVDADEYEQLILQYQGAMQAQASNPEAQPIQQPIPPMIGGDGQPMMRKVKRKKVRCYIISGNEVLEGPFDWVGNRIPIIPVWGEIYRVGDNLVRHSLISFAKDSQRMLNYWRSASVESLALAPKAPWLVTKKQIEGLEGFWNSIGQGNPSYLIYNPDPQGGGRPERVQPAAPAAGMLQEAALSQDDLKATTGIYDASLGNRSNESSGIAIQARQDQGDISTYAFLDNLKNAVEEIGRIIVNIIPKIYDTQRQVRVLGKKDESEIIEVNNGRYDLQRGKYDVHIQTGPSFSSQREKFVAMAQEVARNAPQTLPILLPKILDALDMPDAEEIGQQLQQLLTPKPQEPNPKDQAQASKYQADADKVKVETAALVNDLVQSKLLDQFGGQMPTDDPMQGQIVSGQ